MPPPIPVVLAEYDLAWPEAAARLAARLAVLGPVVAKVHHIGSTSVPGLAARPIIDRTRAAREGDAKAAWIEATEKRALLWARERRPLRAPS